MQRKGGATRIVLVGAAVLLIVLAVIYGNGATKYAESYFSNTSARGIEFADQTPEQVQALANQQLSTYELRITGQGLDLNIPAAEIELHYVSSHPAQDVLNSQNAAIWPIAALLPHDVSDAFATTFNEEQLSAKISEAVAAHNETAANPLNERLAFSSNTNEWEYAPPQVGSALDATAVCALAKAAVDSLQPTLEVSDTCLLQPEPADNESAIKKAAQKANELCSRYSINGKLTGPKGNADSEDNADSEQSVSFTVDAQQAVQWINIDENYKVSIDREKVDAWLAMVKSLLSGADERTFTRPDGKTCTVSGGDYFWKAENPEAAVEQIRKALSDESKVEVDIPCSTMGAGFLGLPGADWGKRYADVDISEQHARFYNENGELVWETDVVTGLDGTDFETPTGVYTITEKLSPASLRSVGPYTYIDENGETQVEENHVYGRDVEYWMPFIGTFIGFHDAWWQTDFGGDLYKYAAYGSGGCVNLPSDKAAELYGIIAPGDVVVVHY